MVQAFQPISVHNKNYERHFISRQRHHFNDKRLGLVWKNLESKMIQKQKITISELADTSNEAQQFYRFFSNDKVEIEELIRLSCQMESIGLKDRSILLLGDSSSFNLSAHKNRIKDVKSVGVIQNSSTLGFQTHVHLAIRPNKDILGVADILHWSRPTDYKQQKGKSVVWKDKESYRWGLGAKNAHDSTREATQRTFIYDSEADNYELFHYLQLELGDEFIIRSQHNRHLYLEGQSIKVKACLAQLPTLGKYELFIPALKHYSHTGRKWTHRTARHSTIELKATAVQVPPPERLKGQPNLDLYLIEAIEVGDQIPQGEEPVNWIIWTTHPVNSFEEALKIVIYYTLRWIIEQFFRTLKKKGFQVESTELTTFMAIVKQITIAMKAAATVLQLVYARNRKDCQPTSEVFNLKEQEILSKVNEKLEGKTEKQKNPFDPNLLSWAAWVIARLGGWKGYQSQRKPGPIIMRRGIMKFYQYMEMYQLIDST